MRNSDQSLSSKLLLCWPSSTVLENLATVIVYVHVFPRNMVLPPTIILNANIKLWKNSGNMGKTQKVIREYFFQNGESWPLPDPSGIFFPSRSSLSAHQLSEHILWFKSHYQKKKKTNLTIDKGRTLKVLWALTGIIAMTILLSFLS